MKIVFRIGFSSLAALLLITVLVISCGSPMGGINAFVISDDSGEGGSNYGGSHVSLPPGTGAVYISIGNFARTVLPTPMEPVCYWVEFVDSAGFNAADPNEADNGTVVISDVMLPTENGVKLFIVPAGTYYIRVYACIEIVSGHTDAIEKSISRGLATDDSGDPRVISVANGEILNNPGNSINVTKDELYDPTTRTGHGLFTYKLDLTGIDPNFFNTANTALLITDRNNSTVTKTDVKINLMGKTAGIPNLTGSLDLEAGQYSLTLTLQNIAGKRIVYKEIAHVYQNMTSSFVFTKEDIDYYFSLAEDNETLYIEMPAVQSNPLRIVYTYSEDVQYWHDSNYLYAWEATERPDDDLNMFDYILRLHHPTHTGRLVVSAGHGPYTWYIDSQQSPLHYHIGNPPFPSGTANHSSVKDGGTTVFLGGGIQGDYDGGDGTYLEIGYLNAGSEPPPGGKSDGYWAEEPSRSANPWAYIFYDEPLRDEYIISIRSADGYQTDVVILFAYHREDSN